MNRRKLHTKEMTTVKRNVDGRIKGRLI